MACVNPVRIKVKGVTMYVDCGKCMNCNFRRRAEWMLRCMTEYKMAKKNSVYMVTLTYSNESLFPRIDDLIKNCRDDFQRFIKRLRKKVCAQGIKYVAVLEKGSRTGRPHFHIIFYHVPKEKMEFEKMIKECWNYGFVSVYNALPSATNYVLKYVLKDLILKEKSLFMYSKGLGDRYIKENSDRVKSSGKLTIQLNGMEYPLTRKFRRTLYSPEEIEEIIDNMEISSIEEARRKEEKLKEKMKKLMKKDFKLS